MTKLTKILKLDLTEDIKSVIDLEDQKEDEIQQEIESYILTDGLAKHLSDFIKIYNSNIKESGVWISGFYGSGKSYFGKMLGHLLADKLINGTSARDRFIPRIRGVKDESFLEQKIRSLDAIDSTVVFFDSAKQNTENGLSWTMFINFLKELGFRPDKYGLFEFDLFLNDEYDEFQSQIEKLSGEPWSKVKRSNSKTVKFVRRSFLQMDYSEKEFDDLNQANESKKNDFSPAQLRDELKRYLEKNEDKRIVFIFDETSEAINQKKYTLLDLEGISEALSTFGNRVWTVAIAQEKLDDVINNSNVNKSTLIKVTDRFKTKPHLEATEVDTIIRSRLLQKNSDAINDLKSHFNKKEGQIKDLTNLKSSFPTITADAESYATYYPFHKYQFDLLQKFLFTSNQLAASQVAARGMIITTFDVLRNQLADLSLFNTTSAYSICTEAQTAPPSELGIKYDNARKILREQGSEIEGERLLKSIHFLEKSELTDTTIENITKAYLKDADRYYEVKPQIEEALKHLESTKILLSKNHNYKITSNIESKLLEEMNNFTIEVFNKKRHFVTYLKNTGIFKSVHNLNLEGLNYKFNIITDQDDEIESSTNKNLKLKVYSLYNIGDDYEDFVEGTKIESQNEKDTIVIIPDTSSYHIIDDLIVDIRRFSLMEDKYGNDNDQAKRQIIREFSAIKDEKEVLLNSKLKEAYLNGKLIYLFDDNLLDELNFKSEINNNQEKLIRNVYTKRLSSQLSDDIGKKVLKERDKNRLSKYYSGSDFNFFDSNGNFIGDHLKVVEEITAKIKSRFLDGKSLEETFGGVPWGYNYGTISSTLATLFRAGKIVIKYNSKDCFDFRDTEVHEVFINSRKFGTASFKSILQSLSSQQKNDIVQSLHDLEFKEHTGQRVDWNATDFELAQNISLISDHFLTVLKERQKDLSDFNTLFPEASDQKELLQKFTVKTTESNYIKKAESFLVDKVEFMQAIQLVEGANQFIRKNLDKLRGLKKYIHDVENELNKATISNDKIKESITEFNHVLKNDIVTHYSDLQSSAQKCRDEYYRLYKEESMKMSSSYNLLMSKINDVKKEIKDYPTHINQGSQNKLENLKSFVETKIIGDPNMQYHIACRNCGYTLSDVINYLDLFHSKETDLEMLKNSFIKEVPPPTNPHEEGQKKQVAKIRIAIPDTEVTVKEYRNLLAGQLQSMAGMDNDDMVKVIKE